MEEWSPVYTVIGLLMEGVCVYGVCMCVHVHEQSTNHISLIKQA